MTSRYQRPKSMLLGAVVAVLCGMATAPVEAQLVHRSRDGNTLLIDPILCQTDYQIRQAVASLGFTKIALNAPIDDRIRVRATRGRTVYLIDYNRCRGRVVSIQPLRPAN